MICFTFMATDEPTGQLGFPKATLLLANVVLFLFAELVIRALAYYGYTRIAHYPTADPSEYFFADIDRDVGVWHKPNHSARHTTPCFDVRYTSNRYGARDRERSEKSSNPHRVVVLGDSFAEGYGVSDEDRMTNIAERISGIEFLNFGSSGHFGSVQQWLLYKQLAKNFDHSMVALFFLPANDFEDNDPTSHARNRYRPYLRESPTSEFEVYYPVKFEDRQQPPKVTIGRYLRRHLYNNIYSFNLLRQLGEQFEESDFKRAIKDLTPRQESDADSFTDLDLRRLFFSYKNIAALAKERKLTIFVIPTERELYAYSSNRLRDSLLTKLGHFAHTLPHAEVVDLAPEFIEYAQKQHVEIEDFYYDCDLHWSPLGHQVAGQILAKRVKIHAAAARDAGASTFNSSSKELQSDPAAAQDLRN